MKCTGVQASFLKGDVLRYSNLPLKYASWLRAQIYGQKSGFLLYCLNMSCRVIFSRMHDFLTLDIQCLFVNVSLERIKQTSQLIMHLSNFRLNIGAKQLVIDVEDNVV